MLVYLTNFFIAWLAYFWQPKKQPCGSLTLPHIPGVDIISMTRQEVHNYSVATSPPYNLADVHNLDFCNVSVTLTHPGEDDTVSVSVWLPLNNWNGRFQATGGGGLAAGIIGLAPAHPVSQGYATAATDGGLTLNGTSNPQTGAWILRPDGSINTALLLNFAHRSIYDMTIIGKTLTERFYGSPPRYSYWSGCSTGGRQGYFAAAKYPNLFDGVLAGAPALNFPRLIGYMFWPPVHMFHSAAPPQCVFDTFWKAIIDECDPLDGATDGLISDYNPQSCPFKPETLVGHTVTCPEMGSDSPVTITAQHATLVKQILQGPDLQDHPDLWTGLPPGASFRGTANTQVINGSIVRPVPFFPIIGWIKNFVYRDPDYNVFDMTFDDFNTAYRLTLDGYNGILGSDDLNLSEFRRAGGKLLTWHGLADELIPASWTNAFWEGIDKTDGADVDEFYRVFLAPGLGHCSAGHGPKPVDLLGALVRWVEEGIAPDRLSAAAVKADGKELFSVYIFFAVLTRKSKRPPLPPGPRRKPIVGNLWDLPDPSQQDWQHWLKHKDRYGPISSLSIMGQTIIVLNDARLAVELLESRSSIHSSRPQQHFAEMAGWNNVLGAVKQSQRFRATRKNLHREIGSNVSVARFNEIQTAEVGRFLLRVLDAPDKLMKHIRKEAGAIILKVGYGYTIEPHDQDPLVDLADKAMMDFSMAMLPATWAVDFFLPLKYLPSWFPGTEFMKIAQRYRKNVTAFSDIPYAFVKEQMRTGRFVPSFLSNLLESSDLEPGSEEENTVKWSAGSLYAGGADTTVSSIASFFLAMALFPEVQRKAQQELDTVIGTDRLPQYADREQLPYINALVKETFRWHPVVPMSLTHTSTADDVCEGYFIPKGSSVLANIWAFTHDPAAYHDPMTFKPERFLSPKPERDPHFLVFGFGRRVCPGRTLADVNVYLTVAQALAVFEISKPVKNGKVKDVQPEFLPGVISHPAPFDVSIRPRSAKHLELLRSLEQKYPWEKSNAEDLKNI
ncbi:hypothetical protein CBS115989_390 [Aspergillus niger]|nr:hypothetical protein CBS115989_390 [Aspergillus niger]KAI2862759.1 hypothetical protein CBS11232_242 [Aspergillus niger]KAI2875121.1 hypothetical protein CBS115988_5625 [Aspergillus niger]